MPSTQIPVDKRYECYKDVKSGYTIREASRKYGISTFGVRFNVKRVDETGSLRNRTYADRQILQSPATKFIDETLQSRPTTTKKLEIGTVQLHGSSSNVTFIAHIVPDTYTLPPPPQWSTVSYTESISGHVNSHFFEYLYATALIVILCLFCCLLTVLYKSNK